MSLSAKEAAEQVGLTKPGLLKAIKQGKVSATKDHNGEWQIDPAELFRVYPPINASVHKQNTVGLQQNTPEITENTASLQREIELLRERIADKDETIKDLRQRLDAEADERRRLTRLLIHSQEQPQPPNTPSSNLEPEQPPEPKKSFFKRLFS